MTTRMIITEYEGFYELILECTTADDLTIRIALLRTDDEEYAWSTARRIQDVDLSIIWTE